jgi:hypothetical protein
MLESYGLNLDWVDSLLATSVGGKDALNCYLYIIACTVEQLSSFVKLFICDSRPKFRAIQNSSRTNYSNEEFWKRQLFNTSINSQNWFWPRAIPFTRNKILEGELRIQNFSNWIILLTPGRAKRLQNGVLFTTFWNENVNFSFHSYFCIQLRP